MCSIKTMLDLNVKLRLIAWLKFNKTYKLLKGKKVKIKTNKKSIIIFSVHKSASTFLRKLINILSLNSALISIDPATYYALSQDNAKEKLSIHKVLTNLFKEKGFIYGPIRWFVDIPNISNYQILLLLRDPRDVLVSYYYSMRYSHAIIHRDVVCERVIALGMTLDEYVLEKVYEFLKVYEDYMELLKRSNVKFIKYEDMIQNSVLFLDDIQNFFKIKLKEEDYQECLTQLTPKETENVYNHRRSGKSRQFVEKLQDSTLTKINAILNEVLNYYGFEK